MAQDPVRKAPAGTSQNSQSSPAGKDASGAAPNGVVDAGLKSLDHYKRALPRWRYVLRQRILPLIRWETPYLAYFQNKVRTPALDRYFAITANLGTHTFFMVGLPIMFWCGWPAFGKGIVRILALGVFLTGFIKDMCSLPRPLSPPLQRITMSGSTALEYGFPSTHSANAVGVAVYVLLLLRGEAHNFSPTATLAMELLACGYAFSIVVGRLYCGMHGFLDVIVGSAVGAGLALAELYLGPQLEATWLAPDTGFAALLLVTLLVVGMVGAHPEPADDCPCFDDSVAFAGVIIGTEAGTWTLGRSALGAVYLGPRATFDLSALGGLAAAGRIALGVLVVFAWRAITKPALLRFLPSVFRAIERAGLALPRRFFLPASEYGEVALDGLRGDDNVLPRVSELPKMVRSIRGPGRGRSVSIGPQSAADAYETLAYRERRRRESIGSNDAAAAAAAARTPSPAAAASGVQSGRVAEYEQMMGQGTVVVSPAGRPRSQDEAVAATMDEPDLYIGQHDELGEKEMFSKLAKPRVRYDVEVVTKLVVYTGIGWLAVHGCLAIFELVGIGAAQTASA